MRWILRKINVNEVNMIMKKQLNLEKYNEVMPRCYGCKHYDRKLSLFSQRHLHCCNAKFNKGALIFIETIDQCDELQAFKQK